MALMLRPSLVRTWVNQGFSDSNSSNYEAAIHNFLNALSLNPEANHIWDNLETACRSFQRTDLIEKAKARNLEGFRGEFSFIDTSKLPEPNMEALFSHPILNEPENTGSIWDQMP